MFSPDSPCFLVFFYVFPWYSLFSRAFLRFHLFPLVSPCLSCFPLFFYVFPCFLPSQSARVNKSTHPRKFGNHVSDRPTVRPQHRVSNAKFRVVCECIVFGAKTKGRPRFVKHKQLKSSVKSTEKKKKFFVSVDHRAIPQFLIFYWLCPLVWSTEREKGRGNEKVGGKQAKLNGRGSGRELQKGALLWRAAGKGAREKQRKEAQFYWQATGEGARKKHRKKAQFYWRARERDRVLNRFLSRRWSLIK